MPRASAVAAPTKPKAAGKTTAAKSSKTTTKAKPKASNAEATAKRQAEKERYEKAIALAAEQGIVTIFDELAAPSSQDKLANAVNMHLLEGIQRIQQKEVVNADSYNPINPAEFILLDDKLAPTSSKKSVKTDVRGTSRGHTKRAPLKRGTKQTEEPKEENTDEEVEVQLDDSNEEEPAEEVKESKPATKKKNLTTFTRDAKNYLGFIVMKMVDEFYSSDGGKTIKDRNDFTMYVYNSITRDIQSHISRAVVSSVNRMHQLVADFPDRDLPTDLKRLLGHQFTKRNALMTFMFDYISDYLKLIGYTLAQLTWVSRKTVNQQLIEQVVRILDMGNDLIESEDAQDLSLSAGFYQDAHRYAMLVLPPKPVKAKTATKPRGKKATAEAEAEAEEDNEEEAEEDNEEDNEEEEIDVEPAEEEEPEEEEPEEEPAEEEEPEEEEEEVKPPPRKIKTGKK